MRESNGYLDRNVAYAPKPKFRSEGERKISRFLDSNSISYRYEPGVLVDSICGRTRIWYPDYYLPEFKTYIEYYGMAGNRNYDPGITTKRSVYKKMRLDVISVYPWMFKENWQGYIMRELKNNYARNYTNLMSKPYWVQKSRQFNPGNVNNWYRRQRFKGY